MLPGQELQCLCQHFFIQYIGFRRYLLRLIRIIPVGQRHALSLQQISQIQNGSVLQITVILRLQRSPKHLHLFRPCGIDPRVIVACPVRRNTYIISTSLTGRPVQ